MRRPWPLPCLTVFLLLSFLIQSVGAACRLDQVNWQAENSVKQLMTSCERAPTASERLLFTWGHEQKFALLTHDGYGVFRLFNDAQQFAYAGARARPLVRGYADNPLFPTYLEVLRTVIGVAGVGELYRYSQDTEMLSMLQRIWQDQVKAATNPPPADDPNLSAPVAGLMALAVNQVNPGFIDDLPYRLDELVRQTQEALKGDISDQRRRLALQGRLLGLQRAQKAGGFLSNISYGPAVYFSDSPSTALQHFYDGEHSGLACKLQEDDRITDLSDPQDRQAMLNHDVFLRNAAGVAITYPGTYSELTNPPAYRQAALDRIIKHRNVYADTGVIRYQAPGVCRRIRLSDFNDCDSVTKLLRERTFYQGSVPGPLYRFLTFEEAGSQLPVFLGLIRGCSVTPADVKARSDGGQPRLPNSCESLQSADFQQGHFYQANKQYLDEVKRERCS